MQNNIQLIDKITHNIQAIERTEKKRRALRRDKAETNRNKSMTTETQLQHVKEQQEEAIVS